MPRPHDHPDCMKRADPLVFAKARPRLFGNHIYLPAKAPGLGNIEWPLLDNQVFNRQHFYMGKRGAFTTAASRSPFKNFMSYPPMSWNYRDRHQRIYGRFIRQEEHGGSPLKRSIHGEQLDLDMTSICEFLLGIE